MTPASHPSVDASLSSPHTDEADNADMARLTDGQDAALNDLMERHAASLFRFLCRMLGNEEDANDLAQETFVRVYRNRDGFRKGHRFSTWLYTIAANLARNQLRWRERHRNVALDAAIDDQSASLRDTLPDGRPDSSGRMEAVETRIYRARQQLRARLGRFLGKV